MYAELVMIKLGKEMRPMAERVADELAPIYKAMKGVKGVMFIGDVEAGEYGSLSLWESKEDAEALHGTMKGRLERIVGRVPKEGPDTRRIFEIYEVYYPVVKPL